MMEEPTMSRSRPAFATLCAALAARSACGPRHEERRQAEPPATSSPTPTVSASPSASIIRPDITPEPVVDLPPPPLTRTVGFPGGGSRLAAKERQAVRSATRSAKASRAARTGPSGSTVSSAFARWASPTT